MSRIYKKSHVTHSESLSGIAFGGGGGGGGENVGNNNSFTLAAAKDVQEESNLGGESFYPDKGWTGVSSKEKAAACGAAGLAGSLLSTYSPHPFGKAVGVAITAGTTYICTAD